ncbi:uncharacterized protein si:ch211-119e14.1 [Toxotes jaculatrix]|uniref:uncharacterized protein si:ch211-119e14.1 n=1 Tax=Toxotes jaculatrix TaxID=941984 RepID=UPI001B3ABD1B|nr:uncharacterized protein si:ch211-119e14.1 [Toxotes jaculatrix]XP_040886685.1 uncharacterized protein si:ch211-119e14.1 [Toxotes jaculatrix]
MGDSYTIPILCVILISLVLLFIFFYKKLNRETNGEYTIKRMVYKEGGVRDRVRGAAHHTLGTLLRVWRRSDVDVGLEEMQEIQDEEEQVDDGGSQSSDSEEDSQEEEDNNTEQCDKTMGKGNDTSDDKSNLECSGEQSKLMDQSDAKEETKDKKEENEGEGEASGGAGLSIDLKQFSGSAIWSEEAGGEGMDRDVTAL